MASTPTTTILEQCRIAPSPGAEAKLSLSLTFLDLQWLHFHELQRLAFYDFPCSKTHFIDPTIPSIKTSLSIALKHFLPLAGNLIYPLGDDHGRPEILYMAGDTVSLTFAESGKDFNHLTANYARNADDFYSLIPQLPPLTREAGQEIRPLLALKVTLFPDKGICIGYTNNHVVGDASTVIGFIKAWASIHKLGGDAHLQEANLLPVYDRSVINYPRELDNIYWKTIKNFKPQATTVTDHKVDKVRATYVVDREQIQSLKNRVLDKRPNLTHVSAFTVICAYSWTCLVRSSAAAGEELGDDDTEYFLTAVECRARLDPPAPSNYFGNCVAPCDFGLSRKKLMGNEGFVIAAESIGQAIHDFINKEGGVLVGLDKWLPEMFAMMERGSPVFGVAGSPKFDLYDADYGWGKPKKCEAVSIDYDSCSISLSKSRECEGGFEIGLSLPKTKLDAFAAIFADGFKNLQS